MTVAHLFFRQVATNANALPFLPDSLYDLFFPQRGKDRGSPPRGEARRARRWSSNRILIDLSHMDPPGIRETFALLDELDPAKRDAGDLDPRRLSLRHAAVHAATRRPCSRSSGARASSA